jgi:DNA polymerase-3 subunit delta
MPIYLFWGDDDFAIAQAVKKLREEVLDPHWSQFNYDRLSGDEPNATITALTQAMTPVFGMGGRLVWLADANICQQCSDDLLSDLKRIVPAIPPLSHLLITSSKKPDGRVKSTKLLQEYVEFREFSLLPPWKSEEILHRVQQVAQAVGVKLTSAATQLLAESVGNNTRQLWGEMEKLYLYGEQRNGSLDADTIAMLVNSNTQNSLQLATSIRKGDRSLALGLVADLVNRNEPALKIVATLVGQFRTWAIVKLQIEAGEKEEKAIAAAAEIANPKRIYFIRKEIQSLSSQKLLATLPILMELEFSLKRGTEPLAALQTKIVKLCTLFESASP